jgi:AraC-like DNA-binding protein
VSLHFSASWLQKNVLCDIAIKSELLSSLTINVDPFVLFESLSQLERKISDGFFDISDQVVFGKFFWRSKALNMLTAFFEKVTNRPTLQHEIGHSHEHQIAAVEKQLVENIYRGLPNIKTMARKASVTESLLKRYFRKIYGKNIYSYYQEKRMVVAKQLLTEKRKSVTETASIMGYGSVSSFNNTFKRFFGLRPEKVRETMRITTEI